MTMNNLLVLSAFLLYTANAYVSSSPKHGEMKIVKTNPTFVQHPTTQSNNSSKKGIKYDLGLGQNAPVVARKQSEVIHSTNYHDTTQYFNEYEAVNQYPNPNQDAATIHSKNNGSSKKQQTSTKPVVNPIRLAEESLSISGNGSDASAKFQVNPTELDVNTLWVEMLIYDQQQLLEHVWQIN